jgi:hypothetical protein
LHRYFQNSDTLGPQFQTPASMGPWDLKTWTAVFGSRAVPRTDAHMAARVIIKELEDHCTSKREWPF